MEIAGEIAGDQDQGLGRASSLWDVSWNVMLGSVMRGAQPGPAGRGVPDPPRSCASHQGVCVVARPLLQPPLTAAGIASALGPVFGDTSLGHLARQPGALGTAGGSLQLHAAAQPRPLDQTPMSALNQIRALQSVLSPHGAGPGAAVSGWALGGGGVVGSAAGVLGVVGLGASVSPAASIHGPAHMRPLLSPPLRLGGMLSGGADAGITLGASFDPALLNRRDRAAHSTASALSSDETVSRGGSEPCASSDSSDSGDKKCRAWKIMLTAEHAVEIYKQMPQDSLHITNKSVVMGKQYGVSAKTIRDIWKRETWVKATRHVWSDADEQSYRLEESKNSTSAPFSREGPPPGSVASLLSHASDHRSPSPASSPAVPAGAGTARTRGRPKGVKDSRPRKRRCMSVALGGCDPLSSGVSLSSHALYNLHAMYKVHAGGSVPHSITHSAAGSPSPICF